MNRGTELQSGYADCKAGQVVRSGVAGSGTKTRVSLVLFVPPLLAQGRRVPPTSPPAHHINTLTGCVEHSSEEDKKKSVQECRGK